MFVVAGKYEVEAPISEGGMGAVFSAKHIATGRRVALKMLRDEYATEEEVRGRFVQEAKISRGLASPYITKLLDSGIDPKDNAPYIVMELLQGEDVRTLLERRRRLPVGLVLVIAAHVSAGLVEAHGAEIVHRDIKPANVVLTTNVAGELVAKIIDFGIARPRPNDVEVKTRTGQFMGSLPYMSPEQLAGESVDARTDIWSLGVLMYEALAGDRPTGDESALAEVVKRVCTTDLPPLSRAAPWLPDRVTKLVDKTLRRDKAERFASARELHEAITALLVDGVHHPFSVVDGGEDIALAVSTNDGTVPTMLSPVLPRSGPRAIDEPEFAETVLSASDDAPLSLSSEPTRAVVPIPRGALPPSADAPVPVPPVASAVAPADAPVSVPPVASAVAPADAQIPRAAAAAARPQPVAPARSRDASLVTPIAGALLFAILAGALAYAARRDKPAGTVVAPADAAFMDPTPAITSSPAPDAVEDLGPAASTSASASASASADASPPHPSASAKEVRAPIAKPAPHPRPHSKDTKDPLEHP